MTNESTREGMETAEITITQTRNLLMVTREIAPFLTDAEAAQVMGVYVQAMARLGREVGEVQHEKL